MTRVKRRDILKTAAGALAAGVMFPSGIAASQEQQTPTRRRPKARNPRKVVVAGGGIGGLCCAYELMMRGHEVVLFEASGRTGGHVKTIHDPLAEGLYADVGAEHFTKPGYDLYWGYVGEFNLTPLYYPHREHVIRFINGKRYTEEDLANPKALSGFGFTEREIDCLCQHPWWDFASLYLNPYLDSFPDEYKPFAAGLNNLDNVSFNDVLKKDGASPAAIELIGNGGSALHVIWHAAILKKRGVPLAPPVVYRLKGGNQELPNAFAHRLGERVHLNAPVTGIEHGSSGVRVSYREFDQEKTMEADYLVCCMDAYLLRRLPVTPAWPEPKAYAINTVAYDMYSRVVFQSRSAFWERDRISPNWEGADANLAEMWRMAEEVDTPRAILVATAGNGAAAQDALAAFRRIYWGQSEDIEQAVIQTWANEPWAMACETVTYRVGDLKKMWPAIIQPVGRVHFASAYTDNLNWGQEAATRSANRVAEAIDAA
ncbi:MAG TPA: NAD(P)/FAD-dependent oxidoreductase [Terriglobia bacterium]